MRNFLRLLVIISTLFIVSCSPKKGEVKDLKTSFIEGSETIKSFQDKIINNPENQYNYIELALLYKRRGDNKQALKFLSKSLNISPTAQGYIERGIIYRSLYSDYESAIIDFSKALEINPSNKAALINRGQSLLKMNKFKEACNDFREANSEKAENLYSEFCQL